MSKDYYKILDVDKGASQDEIKKAFRKKAHKLHPDKETGDEEKFKEVNEAYQVLGDEKKRAQYDQFGSAAFNGGGGPSWQDMAGGFGGFGGGAQGFDFGDLGDIFGSMFNGGGGRGRQRSERGADIEARLHISFEEAIFGTEKEIALDKVVQCQTCSGSGAKEGSEVETCGKCKGHGQVTVMQNVLFGQVQTQRTCPDCNGKGKKAKHKCADCVGEGIKRGQEKLTVKIPAGISNGETIRLSGHGNAGRTGLDGNLFLHIFVEESKEFQRRGDDILTEVDIKISQALQGDKISVNTVDGEVTLKVPSGTESGTVFRLKGHGVQNVQGRGKGHHYVTINVEIPKSLTRGQKKLLKKMIEEGL